MMENNSDINRKVGVGSKIPFRRNLQLWDSSEAPLGPFVPSVSVGPLPCPGESCRLSSVSLVP